MKTSSHSRRALTGALCFVASSGLALAVTFGCRASEAAPAPAAVANAAANTLGSVAAGPKVETETYTVEMRPSGSYKAGAEGVLEVKLQVKGDYHINKQYPYKFKAADPAPEGVRFGKAVLTREDGNFDEKTASFKVPFTVAKSGKATIGGTIYLSVCSDANCIMDKQVVEAEVDVK